MKEEKRGRKKLALHKRKDRIVCVRLDFVQYSILEEKAADKGWTVSKLVRHKIEGD